MAEDGHESKNAMKCMWKYITTKKMDNDADIDMECCGDYVEHLCLETIVFSFLLIHLISAPKMRGEPQSLELQLAR